MASICALFAAGEGSGKLSFPFREAGEEVEYSISCIWRNGPVLAREGPQIEVFRTDRVPKTRRPSGDCVMPSRTISWLGMVCVRRGLPRKRMLPLRSVSSAR